MHWRIHVWCLLHPVRLCETCFGMCVLLVVDITFHNQLTDKCLRYLMFVYWCVWNYTSPRDVSVLELSLGIPDWTCCHGGPLYLVYIITGIICRGASGFVTVCLCGIWCHPLVPLYFAIFSSRITDNCLVVSCLIFSNQIFFNLVQVICTSIVLTFFKLPKKLYRSVDSIKGIILKPVVAYNENLINPSLILKIAKQYNNWHLRTSVVHQLAFTPHVKLNSIN